MIDLVTHRNSKERKRQADIQKQMLKETRALKNGDCYSHSKPTDRDAGKDSNSEEDAVIDTGRNANIGPNAEVDAATA